MKKHNLLIGITAILFCIVSCTKLNETVYTGLTSTESGGQASMTALLKGAYVSMRAPYQGNDQVFALSELTSDEMIAPTRAGDWDDNGVWRTLHMHTWDADNIHIRDAFNNLGGVVYTTTDLLRFSPSAEQAAEARFLRAYAMFTELDFFDQVPYRDPGEPTTSDARVRKGTEALDYIISQLTDSVINNLSSGNTITQANVYAAKMLLMKCYLNKGVIANRAAPTFDAADMNKVVSLADDIINSSKFSFSKNFFDNFAPDNADLSKENIFTASNVPGDNGGGLSGLWHTVMHYNQNPSGWNGWATLSDFYNKFEASDTRRGVAYPTGAKGPANPGKRINVGFMIGQQYDLTTDEPLKDRTGLALIFTPEVSQIEIGANLEVTGIRPLKYLPDYTNGDNMDNDWVYYRYPDVLLMKAEAILRGGAGTPVEALQLVNSIRTNRGASALISLSLDDILDERGRELYLECTRRQDLIRFGKFLNAWQEKQADASPKTLIFPIPNQQLAVNPNLTQNPGYN